VGRWNVRLLSATYRRAEDDQLSVELYGKVDDGRSLVARYVGFEPYFHLVEPDDDALETLRKDPDVRRVERIELFHRGKLRKAAKVVVRFPWLVPDFRSRLRRQFEVLAADIPFHHRFIYDHDLNACVQIVGEETKGSYRTDLVVDIASRGGGPDISNLEPFNPSLKVLSFDIENSISDGHILTICYVIRENGELREGAPLHGTEREIIDAFTEVIQNEDPDVITGSNIDNYDIPTVMERAKACSSGRLAWGRDLGEPRRTGQRGWKVTGRLVVDAWWAAKMALRPKQETLNYVAKLALGEEKMDVDPSKMDEEWERDRDKVMRYCIKDAELALRILEHVGSLRRTMDLAAVSKLPMEDVQTSGNSTLIDSILIREADRVPAPFGPVGVPLTSRLDDDEDEAIEGGYVHTIEPGLYHWVIVLDFKSMYPSLIISKNICFTTLSDDGEIVSPSGARFLSRERRTGLLPGILSDLMAQRDDIKRRMKASDDPDERRYYNGLQEAVKILMNAFYGVFASSFYRFTDRNIGSAITSFARETTKTLIKRLEEHGIKVIYSDTDSLFIQSPYDNLDETVKFGTEIADRFSREISQMEFEKVFESLFSHAKKRYVGRSVWPTEGMIVRGYEIRRTDSFNLQSELLTEVFEKILDGAPEEGVRVAREAVSRALECKVPVEDLVISRTCKTFSSYKDPDSQANVQTAKKLMAMGYDFVPGMKVSWVVTDSRKTPQEVEPYISGRPFEHRPDCRYYAERLAQTAARATEVFGWGEKDLMTGSQQATLFDASFSSPGPARTKSKPEKKPAKKLDLRDFM
jgi:DNA polymerase I